MCFSSAGSTQGETNGKRISKGRGGEGRGEIRKSGEHHEDQLSSWTSSPNLVMDAGSSRNLVGMRRTNTPHQRVQHLGLGVSAVRGPSDYVLIPSLIMIKPMTDVRGKQQGGGNEGREHAEHGKGNKQQGVPLQKYISRQNDDDVRAYKRQMLL